MGVQRRGKGSIVHDKWLSRQMWSRLLLIHLEFSQFFVAHCSDASAGSASGRAIDLAGTLKNTSTVCKLRCAGLPQLHLLQHLLQTGTRPPLANPGLVLSSPAACRNPCAMASSPFLPLWDAKFFHLTCPQQRPPCSLLPQSHKHSPSRNAPCTDTARC
jgi:hypothetical protein